MVDESGSVSAALMHLFYYQQGLFMDEAQPGSLLREVAAGVSNSPSPQQPPWTQAAQAPAPVPPEPPPPPPRPAELASSFSPTLGALGLADSSTDQKVRELYERRSELQWCLETGSLRAQNEALESQVLKMQLDFLALQEDFRNMKESCTEKLESRSKALEAQQAVTQAAEKRVVCTQDLVRFHEEQRRLMATHWKSMCAMKDERIRYLNLQLTEYTDEYPGARSQTEASLSHEYQCLQDRHSELQAHYSWRSARLEQLECRLAEARAEEGELREAESAAAAAGPASASQAPQPHSEASAAGLRAKLALLRRWRQSREERAGEREGPQWSHSCIWRDELDVRERQLEKITVQLDRTFNALHAAQSALSVQRERHEEMKSRHREAETALREGERQRERWQGHCLEFRRVEAELRRALEARAASKTSSSSGVLGSAIVASGGTLGHGLRGGVHPAGFVPHVKASLEPSQDRGGAATGQSRRWEVPEAEAAPLLPRDGLALLSATFGLE